MKDEVDGLSLSTSTREYTGAAAGISAGVAAAVTIVVAWLLLELTAPGQAYFALAAGVVAVSGKGAEMVSKLKSISAGTKLGLSRYGEAAIFLGWVGIAIGAILVLA